jgi:hypothetical protein
LASAGYILKASIYSFASSAPQLLLKHIHTSTQTDPPPYAVFPLCTFWEGQAGGTADLFVDLKTSQAQTSGVLGIQPSRVDQMDVSTSGSVDDQ